MEEDIKNDTTGSADRNTAFLQRSEVRISTLHRIAGTFVGGAGLTVLLPWLLKDNMANLFRAFGNSFVFPSWFFWLGIFATANIFVLPLIALYFLIVDLIYFYFTHSIIEEVKVIDKNKEVNMIYVPELIIKPLNLNANLDDEVKAASKTIDDLVKSLLILVLRYWKAFLLTLGSVLWTILASMSLDTPSPNEQHHSRITDVTLLVLLLWGPLSSFLVSRPKRLIFQNAKDKKKAMLHFGKNPALNLFEEISLLLSFLCLLASTILISNIESAPFINEKTISSLWGIFNARVFLVLLSWTLWVYASWYKLLQARERFRH
ncbi:MAG: hypothetical protein HZB59_06965 [Ignavibacteriales bacterium]|nr:hypothetical protein [Ignavibacteriales bacterium]